MFTGSRPLCFGCIPTFVAMTISSRLPRAAIHSPMIVSDSPPVLPSTHTE
ncbi:Uncharacterised protein [Mycobacteroides abscessus subsp. abscessus]|nr:Uncharacterised protein [Mycobacteroides abscessus subsp. abscessus]